MNTQKEYLTKLLKENPNTIFVGSLGTISKDLSEIPHNHKVLIKGAMGCAIGVGVGIALTTRKQVTVLIGDGSFLMKAGSMATANRYCKNLKVIIINNNKYASCGGQETNYKYLWKSLPPKRIKKT